MTEAGTRPRPRGPDVVAETVEESIDLASWVERYVQVVLQLEGVRPSRPGVAPASSVG